MFDPDDISSNPRPAAGAETLSDLIEKRLSRRSILAGLGAVSMTGLAGCANETAGSDVATATMPVKPEPIPTFDFAEITRGMDETLHIPQGYDSDILLRWGDPIFADSPAFDPENQTMAAQLKQFGYNNDFIGWVPLPEEDGRERVLLCVNHEYTIGKLMFPGLGENYDAMTREMCEIEMAAHGGSIVELVRDGSGWKPRLDSKYNRRITGAFTPMTLSGPAAGHPRVQTAEDPEGLTVAGTINNCAGGITPWGTYLMAEENVNSNFIGEVPEGHPEAANHVRFGVPGNRYVWGKFVDRYDIGKAPNEPNRYGWVVEVDPLDPESRPKKRTAMGRFKHEGAETIIAPDGRVVVYMGDDQKFDYLYKFVTARAFDPDNADSNRDLLDDGTLYVAQFDAEGGVTWLPLTFGTGPLVAANGFHSQADVMIETRRAADLLEATPMDRPEDVEANPDTGRVYVMLTNNDLRTADDTNVANPRAKNDHGHVIELVEPKEDFASEKSTWSFLLRCGDPKDESAGTLWNPLTTDEGWFSSPDNCAVDPQGRLWIATDGNPKTKAADGLWAIETEGEMRGTSKAFLRCPAGAELCGPRFSSDGRSLFVSVQHPGEGRGSTYAAPTTRWPDFDPAMPPRPSVVVVTRQNGGKIGGDSA